MHLLGDECARFSRLLVGNTASRSVVAVLKCEGTDREGREKMTQTEGCQLLFCTDRVFFYLMSRVENVKIAPSPWTYLGRAFPSFPAYDY